jgi:hypothetical protein
MPNSRMQLVVCVFLLCLLPGVQENTILAQTQVSIGASKDNTLYESPSGDLSNGAGQHFFVGRTTLGLLRRALVAFDVGRSIPSGSQITNVTLTLNMSQTSSGADTIGLHRVLADWGEGTSAALGNEGGGAPATTNDATWIHRFFNTSLWTTSGADYASTASDSLSVSVLGSYTWGSTTAMVSDVQQWFDNPSSNFGWMLVGQETAPHLTKRFDSKELVDSTLRPTLTVTYTPLATVHNGSTAPTTFSLLQNFPNPFNPSTTIQFTLPKSGHVELKIYNMLGQEVATLVNEQRVAGTYSAQWNANSVASGVYFYRLISGEHTSMQKMILAK